MIISNLHQNRMASPTIKNIAHQDHVTDIMKTGLLKVAFLYRDLRAISYPCQGSFSDVILSVPGDKKVVKCHKSVLSRCRLESLIML